MRPPALLMAVSCLLAGCAVQPGIHRARAVVETPPVATSGWRAAVSDDDAPIIDGMAQNWAQAWARVPRRSQATAKAEGALLEPKAGLDHPALPPGSYKCRVVRLGLAAGRAGVQAFPSQFCFVLGGEEGKLSLDKQTGSDLPTGWLYPDGDKRYVFLGAQQRKPGDNSIAYGTDRSRDLVGVVERIGPFRWRLVIPRSDPDGLWVYELTPVPADQQPGASAS